MMAADGEIELEEIGQLQSVVGGDQELINMADSLLSDGRAEQSEQQAFGKALSQFGMTEDGFKGYFETLAIKNNRAIF